MKTPFSNLISDVQQKYRRELLLNIFRLLSSNGQNARPVYSGLRKLPKGGLQELIKSRPFDAVRAEINGTTLTVEVTTKIHGEQNEPDAIRYACYDLSDFQDWFFKVLSKAGIKPEPPADLPAEIAEQFTTSMYSGKIRPDLRPAPMFHLKKKKGR